jgi:anaerobic selenocysteine-containing dehydrogenase
VRRTVHKSCNLCEATCGLLLEVDPRARRVLSIRPDKEDPFTRGHICPKAFALKEVHEDPDRLTRPLMRTRGGGFSEIGWEEALERAAEGLARIQAREGPDAVATYIGNPVAHNFGTGLYSLPLVAALGTRSRFCTNSLDSNPKLAASLFLFGSIARVAVPDLDRTGHLVILGANPLVSNGSVMTAPDVRRRLQAIKERGGRLVVLDPRRTETARIASEHLFIRPGSDALLLAAMARVILEEGLTREGPASPYVRGEGGLRAALAPFAPEAVAGATGIDAQTVRRLARELSRAPAAAVYGRLGTCNQEHGTLASWLVDVLNILTGNLDREGGAMFATPAVDLGGLAARLGREGGFGRWRSRVRGAPEFNEELPVACLAEEVLTPGPGRIRGLVTVAGNPVLSAPNGREVDRALADLEWFVAVDIYRNETTRRAHLILPPAWSLEQDNYEALAHQVAIRDTAKLSPAPLAPEPGMRRDWEVLAGLALRIAERRAPFGPLRLACALLRRLDLVPGPRAALDALLRIGPHRLRLKDLERAPRGIDLGPLKPSLGRILGRRGRTIALDHPLMTAELRRLAGSLARPLALEEGALLLIGRRELRSNNSWGHNAPLLARGPERCTLIMHPDDARARGLTDGERVRISSEAGEVTAPLVVSDEVMPGVVSLPHGWGHDREGSRLSVASRRPGVSANDLTDGRVIDPIAGNPVLNGVEVRVARAAPEPASAVATFASVER